MGLASACTRDSYLRELETRVLEVGVEGKRRYAILADTVLYAEGGGQPADHGWIQTARVDDVQQHGDAVRHYFHGELEPGPARVVVDWVRRHDHMQHHTGQHLLSAILLERRGWKTTAFHMGEDDCDIELVSRDGQEIALDRAALDALEDEVAAEIRAARPVSVRSAALEELEALGVRTRGLPEGHTGDVRLIEIEGIDLNTCGGTHLRSTAEIEAVHLLATERMTRATRLSFVCGRRLRRRLSRREETCARLRSLLKVQDGDLADAAAARLDQLLEKVRRERALVAELAGAAALELTRMDGVLAWRLFPGHDADFLRQVAQRLQELDADRPFLIAAGIADEGVFLMSLGARDDLNVRELGAEVAQLLAGRGGGTGRHFQGKATAPGNLEHAARTLRSRLQS